MRILLVNDLPPGPGSGVEVHLRRLIEGLRAAGDEVEAFSSAGEVEGLRKALDIWNPRERRRLADAVLEAQPEIVHFHNVARELSASVLGAVRHLPRVMTFHDHRLLGRPDVAHQAPLRAAVIRAKCVLDRNLARRALDASIALSDETAALLDRHGFRDVHRLELFGPVPPEPASPAGMCHDIVFAGRLSTDKGIRPLAEAFASIAERHPDARLVVAGEGPERAVLDGLARSLPGRVVLLGRVEETTVRAAMAHARVVVAPSIQALRPETGPQTVIEAALLGRPVVTTQGVPLARLVEASGGGRVVEPASGVALSEALDELCRDPALASSAGQAARRHALSHHTGAAVIPSLRALYEDLTDRPSRSPRRISR